MEKDPRDYSGAGYKLLMVIEGILVIEVIKVIEAM
jgi:hypothetical protein